MPSNRTYVCVPCRTAKKGYTENCLSCGGPLIMKYKWKAPKKNNDRMWKRIEKGEWYWDRRRIRRAFGTYKAWSTEHIPRQKKGSQTRHTGGYRSDTKVELGA